MRPQIVEQSSKTAHYPDACDAFFHSLARKTLAIGHLMPVPRRPRTRDPKLSANIGVCIAELFVYGPNPMQPCSSAASQSATMASSHAQILRMPRSRTS
jgi:hypothetical protein